MPRFLGIHIELNKSYQELILPTSSMKEEHNTLCFKHNEFVRAYNEFLDNIC